MDELTATVGRRAMTGLLGVDALYRSESEDGEGLAVVNLDTSATYSAESFASYDEAAPYFEELRRDVADLPEADRRLYYDQLCESTQAFMLWRTQGLPFQDQLRRFLHVPPAPVSDRELDRLRADMASLLGGMGYSGDLASKCEAWEERHRVDRDAVPEVLTGLLDEAWSRTEERVLEIPAPRSDGMRVAAVSGVAYNARCDYAARTIELNVDPVLTGPALKHLAVHEGYPGHYLQFKLREVWAAEGSAAADVLLSVVNTASSSVFEGIADTGLEMLDWADSDDDRLQGLMNRYRAGIGTGAAWRLHALGWDEPKVADWLRAQSLIGGEGWVDNRIRFISAPARAALIWSYWWGEPSVAPMWRALSHRDAAGYVRFLYGRMHSVDTVGMVRPPLRR